ncbi:MAG TPA: hypothetical protein DCX52_10915, partial [Massilia sp.]|nr:hypothetical protein [Massilia sp.]
MSELAGLSDTCAGAATASLTTVLPRDPTHGATPEPAQRTALIELLHAHWSEHGAQLPPADLRALLALSARKFYDE